MRLLVLTTSFPSARYPQSGIFVWRLLEQLPEEIQISVLTPGLDRPGAFLSCENRIKVRGVCYAPQAWQTLAHGQGGIPEMLGLRPWRWALVPALCLALFVQTLRHGRRADLIHAHWSVCGVIAGAAGRLLGKPVVVTLRGTDVSAAEKSLLFRQAVYCCGLFCDRLVAVSQAMARRVAGWMPGERGRISLITNGVGTSFHDLAQTCEHRNFPAGNLSTGNFTVGVIGHLIALKNVDTVIRAFAGLMEKSSRLLVVGDGPERGRLEALVARLGQGARVIFTGAVPPETVPGILSRCSVLVLASRSEGRPNVVLEAMAAGVAVVASDIDGVREMIVHGERGLLFPVGDDQRLAAQLKLLMNDPELAQRLAANARQWVEDQALTWENAANRYAALYREVIRRRRLRK